MNAKIKEWLDRYAVPIFFATLAALIVANISRNLFGNIILSAFLGSIADFFVAYGIIAYRDINSRKNKDGKLSFVGILKVIRNMIVEFGPSEYLDTFILRPFWLSVFPLFIPNYSLAIILGSLTAEITYFLPVIISYELRKKVFRD